MNGCESAGAFPKLPMTARASPTMAGFGTIKEKCHAMLSEDAACVVIVIVAGDLAIVDKVGTGESSRELVVV